MKHFAFCCIQLFALAFVLRSQDFSFPDLQGYKTVTNYPVYTTENLWDFIDGAADTYLSCGFENLHVAEYRKGKNVIKLEIYKHKNTDQAFGIYSSERSPSFRFMNLGAQGYKTDGSLNFFKSNYYVKIRTYSESERVMRSLETLALKVAEMLNGTSEMPVILSEFPEIWKKKNEETYIQENVLGHEFLQGAFKALYEDGDVSFSVFIFEKISIDVSRKTVSSYLASAGLEIYDISGGKYFFRDGYNGDIFLAWKDTRIVIITGLTKDQMDIADKYSSEIIRL